MFARAVIAFLALPWLWLVGMPFAQPIGLVPLVLGVVGLLWCVRDFYVFGKGTLAPWAPPKRLVVDGLYRFSRNPMYASVGLILLGWAITFASRGLLAYALAVMAAFHVRVVLGEEPWLARSFGDDWVRYARRVRRWL